jgi:hypothetical protein
MAAENRLRSLSWEAPFYDDEMCGYGFDVVYSCCAGIRLGPQ